LIRIKFYSLGAVQAPFDAYGSTKIVKKSMCRFQPPFFSEKAFLSNLIREGLASLLKVKEKINKFWPLLLDIIILIIK